MKIFSANVALRLSLAAVMVWAGCSSDDKPMATYHADVRPLIETRCATSGCHVGENTNAPFSLETWEHVQPRAAAIVEAVDEGHMPPWHARDEECRELEYDRSLSEAELRKFVGWRNMNYAEGDPAEYVAPAPDANIAPTVEQFGEPNVRLGSSNAYTANPAMVDDYRCLVLDGSGPEGFYEFASDTFVTAGAVFPDQLEVAHHTLVYLVERYAPGADGQMVDNFKALRELDNAEEGPGYTCFGGPRIGGGQLITGWAPGMGVFAFPPGSAMLIPKGSTLVMQMHYNLGHLHSETVPADKTQFGLWTLPEGTTPQNRISAVPYLNRDLMIPANSSKTVLSLEQPVFGNAEIIGVAPHMHTIGTQIRAELVRADGRKECLIDIPNWDFHWQMYYRLKEGMPMHIGDEHRLTCTYDNSAEHQPVDQSGARRAPRDLTWGEGTDDEMCVNFVFASVPFVQPDALHPCAPSKQCIEACATGDSSCFLGCLTRTGSPECLMCAASSIQALGSTLLSQGCGTGLLAVTSCIADCRSETPQNPYCSVSIYSDCKEQFNQLYGCMEPHLRAGEYDAQLATCGVAFGS